MSSELNSKSNTAAGSKSDSQPLWTERAKRLPPKKRLIKLLGRVTFWCAVRTAGLLRPWSVHLLGTSLGSLFFSVSRRHRNVAIANLRAAYPEMSENEVVSTAREVFCHFSREAFQFFRFLALSREQIDEMTDVDGIEHLDKVLALGKGCVAVTAHYGNWEILARKLTIMGYQINVIARDSDDPGMTNITTYVRESGGYRVFDKDQPIIGAFRRLKHNEMLGILPDQNESEGVLVDFFGSPAATATGPAVLSLKSGAPIVPIFAHKMADGRYLARVYEQIEFSPSGDEERDIHELTALFTAAIEREVRTNPSQWLWLHDRWKSGRKVAQVADRQA